MNVSYIDGHKYGAGLDFGQRDFTAMPVMDFTVKRQVDLLHVHGQEWAEIRRQIKRKYQKWHLDVILAEKNSIGSPNIEALRKMGVDVRPFETTNESKAGIMSGLNEAVHDGGWKLQNHPVQVHEMNTFVAYQLPGTGAWRLAAAGEGHDDTVIGLGLSLESGKYAVSEAELEAYGKGEISGSEIDDDMIEYHAEMHGMTYEESKVDLLREVTLSQAMADITRAEELRRQ